MAIEIRRVDYFYCTVEDQPGEAYKVLALLAEQGINLVAMMSIPIGPARTQLTLFPAETNTLTVVAKNTGMVLDVPHPALLVQGDDKLGALADVHASLGSAGVNVFASTGVTVGNKAFGYVIYVRPEQYELATSVLGI